MVSSLVSVVIPTRGRPELCLRAVQSALEQTYADIEITVVVDGPDETTVQSLRQVADPRLKVVELPARAGGSIARNQGVEHSCGRWIAFLDDDDEWLPTKLERQLSVLGGVTDPEHTIVSCQLFYQRRGDRLVVPQLIYDGRTPVSEYLFCRESMGDHRSIQTSTLLVSRALCLRVPFSPGLKKHQDYDFLLRALADGSTQVCMVPEPLVIFHQDHAFGHVGALRDWKFSFDWMNSNRELFTSSARVAFFLTVVAPPMLSSPLIVNFLMKNRRGTRFRGVWFVLFCREWAKAFVRRCIPALRNTTGVL